MKFEWRLNSLHERKWTGHSDTETLLEAIEQWGLETTLNKTKGMFSIALWDKKEIEIFIYQEIEWVRNLFIMGGSIINLFSLQS